MEGRLEYIMLNDQPVILFRHSCKMCPLFSKKQPIMLMKHNKNYIKTLIKAIVNTLIKMFHRLL